MAPRFRIHFTSVELIRKTIKKAFKGIKCNTIIKSNCQIGRFLVLAFLFDALYLSDDHPQIFP